MRRRLVGGGLPRVVVAALLAGGAYFAALPWTNCVFALRSLHLDLLRICTFGTGNPAFEGPGPLWPYPLIAAIYVVAALAVALMRDSTQPIKK